MEVVLCMKLAFLWGAAFESYLSDLGQARDEILEVELKQDSDLAGMDENFLPAVWEMDLS